MKEADNKGGDGDLQSQPTYLLTQTLKMSSSDFQLWWFLANLRAHFRNWIWPTWELQAKSTRKTILFSVFFPVPLVLHLICCVPMGNLSYFLPLHPPQGGSLRQWWEGEQKAEKSSVLLGWCTWHVPQKLPALSVLMGTCDSRDLNPTCLLVSQSHRYVPSKLSSSARSLILALQDFLWSIPLKILLSDLYEKGMLPLEKPSKQGKLGWLKKEALQTVPLLRSDW